VSGVAAIRNGLPRLPATLLGGGVILLLFLACATFPDLIAPYQPAAFDFRALLKPPSLAHPRAFGVAGCRHAR
jgi:peptide/nickel transport system permease protein